MCHFCRLFVLLCFLISSLLLGVKAQVSPDSVLIATDDAYRFDARQLILPASLVGVGAFAVSNPALCHFKEYVNDRMGDISGGHHIGGDNLLRFVPLAAFVAADFCPGVNSRYDFVERALLSATAFGVMAAMVLPVKSAVDEKRPTDDRHNSFPSGHAATAFVGAELMRIGYGNTLGACAYLVASSVAVMRLYNQEHWINDVIAGAGFGILSARIAYWLLPLERRILGLDRHNPLQVALVPSYAATTGSFALACSISF